MRHKHFGASSGKGAPELKDGTDLTFDDLPEEGDDREYLTGKRARKVAAATKTTVIDLFPKNRNCATCGSEMASISSWSSKRLRIVPEHLEVIERGHHTCACNKKLCKDNRPVAAKADQFLMKGRSIEVGVVVEAAAHKFMDHLPAYRMERRHLENGLNLSRKTIDRNLHHLAQHLRPVAKGLWRYALEGQAAHMDETPIKIQAPGRGKCETGFVWTTCRDERRWNPDTHPAVYFHYAQTRAGSVVTELLTPARPKFLHSDGYAGYNKVLNSSDDDRTVRSQRCCAHCRHKFHEVSIATKSKLAGKAVKAIQHLYNVEAAARGHPPEEREKLRQSRSLPTVMKLREMLEHASPDAQGSSRTAINYALKAFGDLKPFIFDGRLEIDNNPAERAIRGVALTRKNSLFAGNHKAGETWAIYLTLFETARLNGVNPRRYVHWLTGEIERSRGEIDPAELMPWHCLEGRISG